MKTLKSIMLGLIILVTFGAAKANTIKADNEALTVNHAVNVYVNAVVHGQSKGLESVLGEDFKYSMMRGQNMVNYDKDQLLDMLKATEKVDQECKTDIAITDSTPVSTTVKVNMVYANFTRTNYLTLANTGDGWKITSIYSVFK